MWLGNKKCSTSNLHFLRSSNKEKSKPSLCSVLLWENYFFVLWEKFSMYSVDILGSICCVFSHLVLHKYTKQMSGGDTSMPWNWHLLINAVIKYQRLASYRSIFLLKQLIFRPSSMTWIRKFQSLTKSII